MNLPAIDNGRLPLAWFLATSLLWVYTIYYSHRLGRNFTNKYPHIALREIPYAGSHMAHPERAIYFFRRRARDVLQNPDLWKQRQYFIYLSLLSLIAPIGGFSALLI